MELFKAHQQWKNRPIDERFKSVMALHEACSAYRDVAHEASVPFNQLRVEANLDDINLVGKTGTTATLTNWAFNQVSQRAGAPAGYLRQLPATLAAQNINHGLKVRGEENNDTASLLFHKNGSLVLRAATSEKYSRIWNNDITEKLLALQENNPNWINPLAYKVLSQGNNGSWPTMSGDMEPAGLYASDHDMFAFLVDESKTLDGGPQGLNRGFFTWNSEVGAASFGIMTFLYDKVCGNNIVWGASQVTEFRIRHIGNADVKAFNQFQGELRKYAESSTSDLEAKIEKARTFQLGATKDEALESLLGIAHKVKANDLSKSKLSDALELAEQRENRYGNPLSLWAAVGGLTEASQWSGHADERMKIDRAAGKLLKTIEF